MMASAFASTARDDAEVEFLKGGSSWRSFASGDIFGELAVIHGSPQRPLGSEAHVMIFVRFVPEAEIWLSSDRCRISAHASQAGEVHGVLIKTKSPSLARKGAD
jgi:hypothetical protein